MKQATTLTCGSPIPRIKDNAASGKIFSGMVSHCNLTAIRTFSLTLILTILLGSNAALHAQADANGSQGDDMTFFTDDEVNFLFSSKNRPWNYGRISVGTIYMKEFGDLKDILTYQNTFILSLDHGIHHLLNPPYQRKPAFVPGFRAEVLFSRFGEAPVTATTPLAGLIWLIPIGKAHNGVIMAGATGGISFMQSASSAFMFSNNALTVQTYLGYEYFLSNLYISIHGRFGYVSDSTYPLMHAGGGLSIGYRFDNKRISLRKE